MAKNLQLNWEVFAFSEGHLDEMVFPLLCPRCLKKTETLLIIPLQGEIKGIRKKQPYLFASRAKRRQYGN